MSGGGARPGAGGPAGAWRIGDCLAWTCAFFRDRGLPSPRLDAEVLLAHALEVARIYLYTYPERPLDAGELGAFRQLVKRRAVGEPVAYIVGEREFFGRLFRVDRRVLIPRPETEHLVEVALRALRGRGDAAARLHEVGCGSGAVAITLALEVADAQVGASDLSGDAVAAATANAHRLAGEALAAGRLHFGEADLLAGAGDGLDLVVANPPYVAATAPLPPDVRDWEPRLALVAGDEGTDLLARLVREAPAHLAAGGTLAMEMGAGQAAAVRRMFAAASGWGEVAVDHDLQGHPRVATCRWRPAAEAA